MPRIACGGFYPRILPAQDSRNLGNHGKLGRQAMARQAISRVSEQAWVAVRLWICQLFVWENSTDKSTVLLAWEATFICNWTSGVFPVLGIPPKSIKTVDLNIDHFNIFRCNDISCLKSNDSIINSHAEKKYKFINISTLLSQSQDPLHTWQMTMQIRTLY